MERTHRRESSGVEGADRVGGRQHQQDRFVKRAVVRDAHVEDKGKEGEGGGGG